MSFMDAYSVKEIYLWNFLHLYYNSVLISQAQISSQAQTMHLGQMFSYHYENLDDYYHNILPNMCIPDLSE